MNHAEARTIALALPGAEEADHGGKPSFRVNGKIFVIIQADGRTLTVKTTKEERALLASAEPQTYGVPEGFAHLSYMHIQLKTAEDEQVRNLIEAAWGLVAPKKTVKAYFCGGANA
ncbi:MmcQ/YjbR family DNA-binding protein [Paenibacillus xanthanilyticus]|uniref:MmcQ/YjbR family DNA-binding protein n=1 Tax=Paenibacillus xanthanilyticus TaxID=1783531 RepID=A0ABV8JXJ0_9BACL